MKNKVIFSILIISLLTAGAMAQNRDADDYQTEFIWGVNKNTAGGLIGGFVFRKSFQIKEGLFQSYGLEVMMVSNSLLKNGTQTTT